MDPFGVLSNRWPFLGPPGSFPWLRRVFFSSGEMTTTMALMYGDELMMMLPATDDDKSEE